MLRQLQGGAKLGLPHSRPMPGISARCHELRVVDEGATWRIVYRLDDDAVVIVDVFSKKTRQTPGHVIVDCRRRLRQYDELTHRLELSQRLHMLSKTCYSRVCGC